MATVFEVFDSSLWLVLHLSLFVLFDLFQCHPAGEADTHHAAVAPPPRGREVKDFLPVAFSLYSSLDKLGCQTLLTVPTNCADFKLMSLYSFFFL